MWSLGIITMDLLQSSLWAFDVLLNIAGTSALNKLCMGHNVSGCTWYTTHSVQILQKQSECNTHCHCGPKKAIVVITDWAHWFHDNWKACLVRKYGKDHCLHWSCDIAWQQLQIELTWWYTLSKQFDQHSSWLVYLKILLQI